MQPLHLHSERLADFRIRCTHWHTQKLDKSLRSGPGPVRSTRHTNTILDNAMTSLDKYPINPMVRNNPPAPVARRGGAVVVHETGQSLWDGHFRTHNENLIEPTWESMPEAVKWQLAGRDTLPGPVRHSYAAAPKVVRSHDGHIESISGWRLHDQGVFVAHAERPLELVDTNSSRPAGEWLTSWRQVNGPSFQLKHDRIDAGIYRGPAIRVVSLAFRDIWQSVPPRIQRLLHHATEPANDDARWWVRVDGAQIRMTLIYQCAGPTVFSAVHQTKTIPASSIDAGPEQVARRITDAPWNAYVFRAAIPDPPGAELTDTRRRALGQGRTED